MKLMQWNVFSFVAAACFVTASVWADAGDSSVSQDGKTGDKADVTACDELPTGELTPAQLEKLVPEGSPGKVRIRWRTETQEDNYGFNIFRAKDKPTSYTKINTSIIPGEGSTNIPKDYCYMDTAVQRGEVYYYHIESVSTAGVAEILEGTKDTRVKVKTVPEEREWLRKKAAGEDTSSTATAPAKIAETTPVAVMSMDSQAKTGAAPAAKEKNPLE